MKKRINIIELKNIQNEKKINILSKNKNISGQSFNNTNKKCLLIIFLIIYIFIFYKKKEISFETNIYEGFSSEYEKNLFLKNKTDFYYRERKRFCKNYDESNLVTFEDKGNYLIIHESAEYKSKIVDKIKLSDYSKKILGKDICVPIIKIYDNASEINLDDLPDKFVLKCNHGSAMNIFCKDKSKFDLEMAKKQLNKWLNINYGLNKAEFQYYFIKRKILASPFLGDEIIDYKAYCFNGNPEFILGKINSKKDHQYVCNFYDLNWTLTNIEYNYSQYYRDPNVIIEKPKNLQLIIDYSKKLSKEFVFVRVDFLEINGILYLGELTFTPLNFNKVFKNETLNKYLGNLLDVTKIKPYLFNK